MSTSITTHTNYNNIELDLRKHFFLFVTNAVFDISFSDFSVSFILYNIEFQVILLCVCSL